MELRVVRQDGSEVNSNNEDVGEILVKGDTITPGYWHQPDQTSTRIVEGWLHTLTLFFPVGQRMQMSLYGGLRRDTTFDAISPEGP